MIGRRSGGTSADSFTKIDRIRRVESSRVEGKSEENTGQKVFQLVVLLMRQSVESVDHRVKIEVVVRFVLRLIRLGNVENILELGVLS